MWSRLENTTPYHSYSDKEIRTMVRNENNSLSKIEFVIRYFNSSWISPFATEEQTQELCDTELTKVPKHNFFNYALAQLEKDIDAKEDYLLTAAKSCMPCHVSFSAQAAYEASLLYYPKKEQPFTTCLAWFSKAIILGSDDAAMDFLNNNLLKKNKPFDLVMMCTVFITTHLSGKKIAGLAKSRLINDFANAQKDNSPRRDMSLLVDAYQYPNHPKALHQLDSPIRKIAEWLVSHRPGGFVFYFDYCFKNDIISQDAFVNLMQFYLNSGFTDKADLRQRAIDVLNNHNLINHLNYNFTNQQTSFAQFAPVATYTYPAIHSMLQASAPALVEAPSSYYYMYTTAPDMMPAAAPQQPMLVPEYRPASSVIPATPNNTPINSNIYSHQPVQYADMGAYYALK